jgi:1-acyl-sn-glycerol-3-phosphate acyltransferase
MKGMYRIGWNVCRPLFWVLFGFRPIGADNVPMTGPVIVAANHQSYFDPPLIGAGVFREFHYFAKRELFTVPGFGRLISILNAIPVRRGVYDPASLARVKDVLSAGGAVLMFPEGTRAKGDDFLPPKPGVGMIAKHAGVPIVPAYLHRSDRLLRALFARKHVRAYYGTPITPAEQERFPDTKEGYRALSGYVMEHIERLKVVAEGGR